MTSTPDIEKRRPLVTGQDPCVYAEVKQHNEEFFQRTPQLKAVREVLRDQFPEFSFCTKVFPHQQDKRNCYELRERVAPTFDEPQIVLATDGSQVIEGSQTEIGDESFVFCIAVWKTLVGVELFLVKDAVFSDDPNVERMITELTAFRNKYPFAYPFPFHRGKPEFCDKEAAPEHVVAGASPEVELALA
ncbi:MAG TPA: hypothetical protein VLA04_00800 [Verrucomicrobiae bacterium]|nr:hypothetical protein [Verrucomicrobiae bacterium]